MLVIVYVSFGVLSALCGIFHFWCKTGQRDEMVIANPNFVSFQNSYFKVYFLALMAEWLQGPYLYKLYSHYGFIDTQIAIIYVCGFASSVVFGTSSGYFASVFGRKKACVVFTLLYSLCCLTKLSRNYGILILGRILGGVSTSLLFTAFDAWYLYEHTQTHNFPSEWVSATFAKATLYNSIISVVAGILANTIAEWMPFGPVAPFVLAIPFLIATGILIQFTWDENYGGKNNKVIQPCIESLRHIVTNNKVMSIGIVTSLFESAMYIFVFLWTPVLDRGHLYPPLGIIFSCFMLCVTLGGFLFNFTIKLGINPANVVILTVIVASGANIGAIFSSAQNPRLSFVMFIILELACGVYFPAMGWLRQRILPEAHHAGIINWFRVPLNAIAAIVLMVLHDTHSIHGISAIFALCSLLLAVAGIAAVRLSILSRNDENLKLVHDMEEGL
ncbi:molybdate-anion transporter-like [Stylophora pistillata]|uniref:Molybdate-anion transporter n=1 Tax=Stylophora pistillata TaxID=50429 RepID=A0A2B4RFH2_STYPI|nr:molybdate-anion transporter-like [Stylophora pistillata]PFX17114.1 Molybdate-anion transporter [Stylophora pistillata]